MRLSFDSAKSERNIRLRGLPFEEVANFDFDAALVVVDGRQDYGETRYIAIGRLYNRVHVLCFAETVDGIRVISFRKANTREVNRYEKSRAPD
jgi:uncharacterized DUF497 family protein